MSPGWWVVKRGEEYLTPGDGAWSSRQKDATQFALYPGEVLDGCRVVRVRARQPSRAIDFATGLENSKPRTV